MKLYKLDMIIDGYGGLLPLKWFKNFEDAKKEMMKNQAIYEWKGKYEIEGCKETRTYEEDDELHIAGVCYSDKEVEEEPMLLRYAFIAISPEEFDFESDTLYALYVKEGFTSMWRDAGRLSYTIPIRDEPLGYAPTEKKIKKLSKKYKRYPRLWNRYDEDKFSIWGYGDYLSFKKYIIH